MWPASKAIPKELFPVGRMPTILHLIGEFAAAGIRRVIVVAAPKQTGFFDALFDRAVAAPARMADDPLSREFDRILDEVEITVMPQRGTYGNAMPLITAAPFVKDEPCVYAFGDDLVFGENATQGLLDAYRRRRRPVLAAQAVEPAKKSSFGIVETQVEDGALAVTRLIEKPGPSETASNLAAFGRYLVTPDLLESLLAVRPGKDGEVWFVDAVIQQLKDGKPIYACPLTTGQWLTVGDPEGYRRAVLAAAGMDSILASAPGVVA